MTVKNKKRFIVLGIICFAMLSGKHNAHAETISESNGKTVYTVYTREEFLTEVYNDVMNENCNVIIRMPDAALFKEMIYEMDLRQKNAADDEYEDVESDLDFGDIIKLHAKEFINEDEELLNTLGVYNKYGILKERTDASTDLVYTIDQKSDGWYWTFSYMDGSIINEEDYEAMMNKVTNAMKTLDLGPKNDYQRLKAVCDWITSNADYDYTYSNTSDYDNIMSGSSVCAGYADATDLILRAVGYKSQMVIAENINHGWNIVLLHNKWYMIDNTWDDCIGGYKYFLYGTETAADKITMGGVIGEDEGDLYYYDLSQYVNDQAPLATSYYSGNDTTYYLNSWLIDITDANVRATVGDTIALKKDQLTKVTISDPSVASIEDGKIVCHKAGRVNITRTDGTYVSHFFVLVSDKTSLTLDKAEYSLKKGQCTVISSKVINASPSEISYSSSDKKIASVNADGKIVAKKNGKSVITVKLGSILKNITVIVK